MRAQSIDKQRERVRQRERVEGSGWQSETVSVSETGERQRPLPIAFSIAHAHSKKVSNKFSRLKCNETATHSKMQPQCEWLLKGGGEEEGAGSRVV